MLAAAVVPLPCHATDDAAPPIERWQTASGARVLFVENHALPIVDIQVDFAAGTAYENVGRRASLP
jgi:zinc protease